MASFLASLRRGGPAIGDVGDVFERHSAPDAARRPYEARQHAERLHEERAERARSDAMLQALAAREAERRRRGG